MTMHRTNTVLPDDIAPCTPAGHVRLPSAVELAALVDIGLRRDDIARYFGAPLADVTIVLDCLGVHGQDD